MHSVNGVNGMKIHPIVLRRARVSAEDLTELMVKDFGGNLVRLCVSFPLILFTHPPSRQELWQDHRGCRPVAISM